MPFADVTREPVALAGIEADQRYFVRNRGPDVVYLETTSAAPEPASKDATPIAPFPHPKCDLYPVAEEGESIYVWTKGKEVALVVFEAAD